MTGGARRLTREGCLELRRELVNLGYGQADHETPAEPGRRLSGVMTPHRCTRPGARPSRP